MPEAFVENLYALFRSMSELPGGELAETDTGSRHHAFPANPMFNGTWATRLAPEDVDDAVAEVEGWFPSRGAPAIFWWVDPDTTPQDLGTRLEARGWVPWELAAPGMAAPIDELDLDAVRRVPAGYRQGRVEDAAGMDDFARAFVAGFEVPEWAARSWVDATLAFGVANAPWQVYVGYLEDRPVACTLLFRGAGVASVFGVAVAPEARGRGIGAAVTLAPFVDAQQEGETEAVLFATELGAPVYHRIGFKDVGASMSRYLWRGSAADLQQVGLS